MNRVFGKARFAHLALLFLLLVTRAALAQVEQGRVVGRVTDAQGAVVAGATVQLTNLETNIAQTATTDNSGNYIITPVPAGNYGISVTASGFAKTNIPRFELQVGQIVRKDIACPRAISNLRSSTTSKATPERCVVLRYCGVADA